MPTVVEMMRSADYKRFRVALDTMRAPCKWPGGELKVPTGDVSAGVGGLVGTAYNYWLTHALLPIGDERLQRIDASHYVDLACGAGLRAVDLERGRSHYLSPKKVSSKHARWLEVLGNAKYRSCWDSDEEIAALLFYAELEHGYRGSVLWWNPVSIFKQPKNAADQLRLLMQSTDFGLFRDPVILNPIFSYQGTNRTILADADFISGKTLVEVKSGKTITWQVTLRQLLTYWGLNNLLPRPFRIERLAAYYPRYEVWYTADINDICTTAQQQAVIALIKSTADGERPGGKKINKGSNPQFERTRNRQTGSLRRVRKQKEKRR